MSSSGKQKRPPKSQNRKELFPIVEAFGYRWDATSEEARQATEQEFCRFAKKACEKLRQYGFGSCSVTYAAKHDEGKSYTYAVCDHRLDGDPVIHVIADHFGTKEYHLIPEVVLTEPRTSFDYVVQAADNPNDVIAIETQSIDTRGGSVRPAWRAWTEGKSSEWRAFFTEEAARTGRKDTVNYGVNMANIYKRLGLQVAVKGSYLKGIGVRLYVLMQERPFQYLRRRICFRPCAEGEPWDITFVTFDYEDATEPNGVIPFVHKQTIRTTVADYISALSSDPGMAQEAREDFLKRVGRKKAHLDK